MPIRSSGLLSAALFGVAVLLGVAFGSTRSVLAGPCAPETVDNTNYVICTVDPAKADLRLFWKGDDGAPYRSFPGIADAMTAKGKTLVFALNAGMYHEDFSPIGLYVEDGQELRPVASVKAPKASGPVPNFYKNPNGIFFIGDKGAGILPTATFEKQRPDVRLATQSGPMLVIFKPDQPDPHRRLQRPDAA